MSIDPHRDHRRDQPRDQYRHRLTSFDDFFFQLDGRHVSVDHQMWRVEVCGVHSVDSDHWVQVNICGDVSYGATFHSDILDASRFLTMITAWLPTALIQPALRPVAHSVG